MLRSLANGVSDFLEESSSSSDEDDGPVGFAAPAPTTPTRPPPPSPPKRKQQPATVAPKQQQRATVVVDSETDTDKDYNDDDSFTADSYSYEETASEGDEDGESFICDDDDDSTSRELRKMCYRLSIDDSRMTEVELQVAAIGTAEEDLGELLATNSVLTKISLVCPGGPTRRKNVDGQQEEEERCQPHDEQQHQLNQRNFKVLCGGLAKSSSILHVHIQNAELDREAANVLGTALSQKAPLQSVTLKNCTFVGSGLAVLFIGLQHNPRIQSLIMHSCDLNDTRHSDVVAASLPFMKLKSLALINTNLSLSGLAFLYENIEQSPKLAMLNLSRNSKVARRGSIKLLVSCLQSPHQRLEKLSLAACGLDDTAVAKLCKGLATGQGQLQHSGAAALSSLTLSNNSGIGDAGAACLKKLLEQNKDLVELHVDGCRISKKQLKEIADGLRYNNSFLKSLFSETTSKAIFDSVDFIENLGASGQKTVAQVVSPK